MDIDLFNPFITSTKDMIFQMSGMEVESFENLGHEGQEVTSLGVTSIIAFTGKQKGRFLIDMEPDVALVLASSIMGNDFADVRDNMVLLAISEMNNIIAGDAVTSLNNSYSLSLRLAPPIVFTGKEVVISIPKISSVSALGKTKYGLININIAWEGVK